MMSAVQIRTDGDTVTPLALGGGVVSGKFRY